MAFANSKDNVKKINYKVWVGIIGATTGSFKQVFEAGNQIGAIAAEPMIGEEKGEDIPLADGSKPTISKNASVDVTVLNVTKANRDALIETINKEVIVYFQAEGNWGADNDVIPNSASPAPGDWMIKGVNVFPALTIKGQAVNQIQITGTKEVAPTDVATIVGGAG